MKFGKINLRDWTYCSPHEWARHEDHFFSSGSVHLLKNYQINNYGGWNVHFHGKLSFLNKIYQNTDGKIFNWNEDRAALQYVDKFMQRMHKLKVFT